MRISHWLYPVHVLGPGRRLALWVQGCSRRCPGCVSPEFQGPGGTVYAVEDLADALNAILRLEALTGVTISGGEPFEQAEDLLALCRRLDCADILVYSGFSTPELRERFGDSPRKSGIGVLVTGPYVEALNDDAPLRGSSDQEIVFLRPELQETYERWLRDVPREQELFVSADHVYLAGLPPKGQGDIGAQIEKILQEGTL